MPGDAEFTSAPISRSGRYDLFLWDFDGTLAHSWPQGLKVFNEIAARRGFAPITDPQSLRRMRPREFLRQHRIRLWHIAGLVREWQRGMAAYMSEVELFPGIHEALRTLQQAGIRHGILSSNTVDNIRSCLRSRGIEEMFEVIQSAPRLSGKGRALRRMLKDLALDPARVVYIGDEARDVLAARKAGISSGAVGWGLHPLDQLAAHAPTHLIATTDALPFLG
jgi:phosphoglycolate phosphatase